MAIATLITVPPPPPPPPKKRVNLELTYEEALVIIDLCGNVSGSGPRRSAATDVYEALRKAGVETLCQRCVEPSAFVPSDPVYDGFRFREGAV
jgi:hypothetical protein